MYTVSGHVESENVKFDVIYNANEDCNITYIGKINKDQNEIIGKCHLCKSVEKEGEFWIKLPS